MTLADYGMPIADRSPKMAELLDELETIDGYFDYNVPPFLRTALDDRPLLAHLQKAYAAKDFIVDSAADVKRYARQGDLVMKKGHYRGAAQLVPDQEYVLEALEDGMGRLRAGKRKALAPLDKLLAVRVDGVIFSYSLQTAELAERDAAIVSALPEDRLAKVLGSHNVRVRYQGDPTFEDHVLDGSLGIILGLTDEKYHIAWRRGKTSQHTLELVSGEYRKTWRSFRPCAADEFKLIIPNNVPIGELLRKHIDDPGELR